MTENERAFILGLTKLTKKTGIAIDGCGCCGSPYLSKLRSVSEEEGYIIEDDLTNLIWMSLDNKCWEKNHENIIK